MERRWIRALVGALASLVLLSGSVSAAGSVSATLGGKEISLDSAGTLSCHDFDYPVLRCFSSPAALDLAVSRRLADPKGAIIVAAGYVIVYEHAGYDGAHLTLAADQPWLSSVGWNDQISSFKSFGSTGRFRENSPGSGFVYSYGPSSQIPFLSSTYNDKFSAFDAN